MQIGFCMDTNKHTYPHARIYIYICIHIHTDVHIHIVYTCVCAYAYLAASTILKRPGQMRSIALRTAQHSHRAYFLQPPYVQSLHSSTSQPPTNESWPELVFSKRGRSMDLRRGPSHHLNQHIMTRVQAISGQSKGPCTFIYGSYLGLEGVTL